MTEITWPTPFGYTDFCDDIRQEQFGKTTLVGVYNAEMSVFGTIPAVIPKFMLAVHYFERPEEGSVPLQLRIYLPGDAEDAPNQRVDIPPREYQFPPDGDQDLRAAINFAVGLTPLIVTQSGSIKVRMQRGDDIVRLGSLRVNVLSQEEAVAAGLIATPGG